MKLIPLSQGKSAKVDDADFDWLASYRWSFNGRYAVRVEDGHSITMHRLIARTPENLETDHINRDRLDNQRSNLRHCTRQENERNKLAQSNSATGIRGVHWHKRLNKYQARIKFNGKIITIGTFGDIEDAKRARYAAQDKYFGSFAATGVK